MESYLAKQYTLWVNPIFFYIYNHSLVGTLQTKCTFQNKFHYNSPILPALD